MPIFLISFWGFEFKGLSIPTLSVTLAILCSILFSDLLKKMLINPLLPIGIIILLSYLVSNFLFPNRIGGVYYSNLNFIEDLYSLSVFIYFYSLGMLIYDESNKIKTSISKTIVIGVIANGILCLMTRGFFNEYFFQRLWNPYMLSFIPLLGILSVPNKKRYYWTLPIILILFVYAESLQIKICAALFLITSFVIPTRFFSINRKVFGYFTIIGLIGGLIFLLSIDPLYIAKLDHNSGVRLIFWREALDYFKRNPFGMGMGVSIVTGDMSLINESLFHGKKFLEDMGVHSGIMSLLYRFGFFSMFFFYLFFLKPFFCLNKDPHLGRSSMCLLLISVTSLIANESIFAPHFSASTGLCFGLLSKIGENNQSVH